jgi:hypothetical protein
MRGIILSLSFICLALIAIMAASCGSSSNSGGSGACTGGPYNVVGDWTLNVSGTGGSSSGPGVINSSGLAVFFQTTTSSPAPGDTVVMPAITGTCSFSGTATAYGTPASGDGSATQTVNGHVNSAISISGTLSNGNSFSMTPVTPLTGSVTALSGTGWQGEVEGATQPIIWNIAITPTGSNNSMSFTGTSAACNITGTFNQEATGGANPNVFDVTVTTIQGCPFDNFTGIGFESSSDYFGMNGGAAGTYFYAVASVNTAVVLEIFSPAL